MSKLFFVPHYFTFCFFEIRIKFYHETSLAHVWHNKILNGAEKNIIGTNFYIVCNTIFGFVRHEAIFLWEESSTSSPPLTTSRASANARQQYCSAPGRLAERALSWQATSISGAPPPTNNTILNIHLITKRVREREMDREKREKAPVYFKLF